MAFQLRASKYRHVFGTSAKRENCFENFKVSLNAWDSNLVKVNPTYLALNWNAGGGGAFAAIPLSQIGKLPQDQPLFTGHTAAVLDTDFSPFHDNIIASCGEDGKVLVWIIPDGGLVENNEPNPAISLVGHARKVGHVLFHPTADHLLVSCGADLRTKLWDVEKGKEASELRVHGEVVQSVDWNYRGNLLGTTCRDKKIRIIDMRQRQVAQEAQGHQGIKGSRLIWLGETNCIATTGFSKSSDRQVMVFDTRQITVQPLQQMSIDASSGVLMPFYDNDSHMLFLAGKGDGNIRYFEFDSSFDSNPLYALSEYRSSDPQRGMAFMPKRALNVNECEIARAYKLSNFLIEPISFTVPRKSDVFQDDLFPPTKSGEPSLTAEEWLNGADADPKLVDLSQGYVPPARNVSSLKLPAIYTEVPTSPSQQQQQQQQQHALTLPRSPGLFPAQRAGSFSLASGQDAEILALKEENEQLKKTIEDHEHRLQVLEAKFAKAFPEN